MLNIETLNQITMKTLKQVDKYLRENYTIDEIPNDIQLSMLFAFCQNNKHKTIEEIADLGTIIHLINKYCWLYTIAEMIAILQKKEGIKMDLICSSLVQKLKTEQARGNVMLVTYSKKIKSQIYKYL